MKIIFNTKNVNIIYVTWNPPFKKAIRIIENAHIKKLNFNSPVSPLLILLISVHHEAKRKKEKTP